MSETQRTLFNRRACYLSIAGALLLLGLVVVVRVPSPSPPPVKDRTVVSEPRRVRLTPVVFDSDAFYRTIIDNNLFRPLGWRPLHPVEPYRYIS